MSHIAFLVPPTVGHVNPTLALVEELVSRGHRVTFITGPATTAAASRAGARIIEVPLVVHDARHGDAGFRTVELARTLNRLVQDTRAVLPDVVEALEQDPPDVVCHDALSFVGSGLAARFGAPAVTLVPHMVDNECFSMAMSMTAYGFDLAEPAMATFAVASAALAAEASSGVTPVPGQPLTLAFVPRRFQIAGDTFGDHVRFIGPSVPSKRDEPSWQPDDLRGPLLYVSLGTIMNNRPEFFRLCVSAFADTEWHVAMAVGDLTASSIRDEAPPNFDIRPRFPQLAVLRSAQAFVTHAGMNSVMEAVREEVPMIAVPQTPEGAVNAHRLAELELGQVVDVGCLTPVAFRAAVEQTARDYTIRRGLTVLANELEAGGGAVMGATAIEKSIRDAQHTAELELGGDGDLA